MEFDTTKILGEIDKVGNYISDKLQVPVEKAYDIMMKQCWFDLSISLIWVLLCIGLMIISIITGRKCIRYIKKYYIEDEDTTTKEDEINGWVAVIYGVISFICGFIPISCIGRDIAKILQITINPEWYMIEKIMTMMNGV